MDYFFLEVLLALVLWSAPALLNYSILIFDLQDFSFWNNHFL